MKLIDLFEEQTEWLLPQGWVLSYDKELSGNHKVYHITRLMDDKVVAVVGTKDTGKDTIGEWYIYTPASPAMYQYAVVKKDQENTLKLKWWVTNRLMDLGYLNKKDLHNAK